MSVATYSFLMAIQRPARGRRRRDARVQRRRSGGERSERGGGMRPLMPATTPTLGEREPATKRRSSPPGILQGAAGHQGVTLEKHTQRRDRRAEQTRPALREGCVHCSARDGGRLVVIAQVDVDDKRRHFTRFKRDRRQPERTMKDEVFRALERVANLLVGNFTVSFHNELRFMAEAAGSACAQTMRAQGVPMEQAVKHTAGALARL